MTNLSWRSFPDARCDGKYNVDESDENYPVLECSRNEHAPETFCIDISYEMVFSKINSEITPMPLSNFGL